MLILGLLLILASVAVGVGLVYDGGENTSFEVLGTSVDTTIAGVFLIGAATMLVFMIGLWLLTSSMGRARRKRGERKESRRRQRDSVAQLEQERSALRAENDRLSEKLASPATSSTAVGSDPGVHARTDGTAGTDTTDHTAVSDLRPAERRVRSTDSEST